MNFLSNNYKSILLFATCLFVTYITGSGIILNYIKFSDPLNEMAMLVLSFSTAILSLFTLTFKNK